MVYVGTKVAAGMNFRLVILLARVEEAGNASTFLQNVRSQSSVQTKDRNAPQRFKLDSRVNSTVTTRVLVPTISKISETPTGRGLNVNGSICLNFVCQFANITAGSTCEIENTGYIAYGPSGEFVYVVSRDNCKVGLYCDTNSTVCIQQKALGASCSADKECSSYNCLPDQTCGETPSNPRHLPMWVYIIIGVGIFGGMIATLIVLFIFHGRQREDEREKRLQYWREQNAFRQNILQMHETARNSIFTNPGSVSRRSALFGTTTEDANAPMLQHAAPAPKSSGLRHYVGEDSGSYEGGSDNEQLVMRTPYAHDNKI
ncbi:hypothetical protein H4582DRAFT_1276672 [Lactarius indigo]|nr:hypothetical protein H4582DRAFT_1276672 [Lactarius indigo]